MVDIEFSDTKNIFAIATYNEDLSEAEAKSYAAEYANNAELISIVKRKRYNLYYFKY